MPADASLPCVCACVADVPPQFRALADQLFYREGRHGEVRQAVVDQLCCHAERYKAFVTSDYTEYVR